MTGPILGVVLAGGRARRMGGADKGLLEAGGVRLLDRVVKRLAPQVDRLILNANGDPERFAAWGLRVVPDSLPDRPGPLAGVLAACEWAAAEAPGIADVATAAADTPFFPEDLVRRLQRARRRSAGARIAIAATRASGGERTHPVFGLWPVSRAPALRRALEVEGVRRILDWTEREGCATALFDDSDGDPFFNVNTPQDLEACRRMAAGGSA